MIRSIVVFTLAMLVLTVARPADKRCQDSSDSHKFPSTRGCQRYMKCHEGRVTQHNCEAGEMFDKEKAECVKVHCPKCDCDTDKTHKDDSNSPHEDRGNDSNDRCFQRICRPCRCSRKPSSRRDRPARRNKQEEQNHEPKTGRKRSRAKKENIGGDILNKHVPKYDKKDKSISDHIKSHVEEHISEENTHLGKSHLENHKSKTEMDEHHLEEHDPKSDKKGDLLDKHSADSGKTDHALEDHDPEHHGQGTKEDSAKASAEHNADEHDSETHP